MKSPVGDQSSPLQGIMTRNGVTTVVPKDPAVIRSTITPAIPAATTAPLQPTLDSPGKVPASNATRPTSANPAKNDPLSNAIGNAQLPGSSEEVPAASALGFNRRGDTVPAGQDALPDEDGQHTGGTGLYAKKFSNPRSADIYSSYVKKLFGGGSDAGAIV
jgi:hypothetical protein